MEDITTQLFQLLILSVLSHRVANWSETEKRESSLPHIISTTWQSGTSFW